MAIFNSYFDITRPGRSNRRRFFPHVCPRTVPEEQRAEALELRRVAFLNEAACMLQLGEMSHVKADSEGFFSHQPETSHTPISH